MDALAKGVAEALEALQSPAQPSRNAEACLERLSKEELAHPELVARLSPADGNLVELCEKAGLVLARSSATAPGLLKACLRLLSALAQHSPPMRRFLAAKLGLPAAAYQCLRNSLRAQSGPEDLLHSLRLLLLLSAEPHLELGPGWTPDLIAFLLKEIIRESKTSAADAEWLPFCLGILANICEHSPEQRRAVRGSDKVGALSKRLVGLLASQSRPVVIYSLSIISLVLEPLRETVFAKKNLNQTIPCIINVLMKGDELLARAAAVSVLVRMGLRDAEGRPGDVESLSESGSQVWLSPVGESLVAFPGLARILGPVATSLVLLSTQPDQMAPILDLFLCFCTVPQLRQPTMDAILNADPVQSRRLKTPLLSLIDTAMPSLPPGADHTLSLKAQRLIRLTIEETVERNLRVSDFVAGEPLVELVQTCVKTPLESRSGAGAGESRRVLEGLRLAKAMAGDEDLRSDVLDVVSGQLCAHVSEFQLLSNPLASGAAASSEPEEWSVVGVWVMVELIQLLALLKDHSGQHKQQYWRLLKDERLLPILAFGVSSGQAPLVSASLSLILHCAQNHAFDPHALAKLIANASKVLSKRGGSSARHSLYEPQTNGHAQRRLSPETETELSSVLHRLREESGKTVMGNGTENGGSGARLSELVSLYEARLDSVREASASAAAVARREAEQDGARLRRLLGESERAGEELRASLAASQTSAAEKEAEAQAEIGRLRSEVAEEAAMAERFRSNYKDMKLKFEAVSKEVLEQKAELGRKVLELAASEAAGKEARRELAETQQTLARVQAEKAELQDHFDRTRSIVTSISELTTKANFQ